MGAAFEAVLAVTKKVTVLIFALFCPRGLESAVSEVSGKAFRGSKDTKRGCRLSCAGGARRRGVRAS